MASNRQMKQKIRVWIQNPDWRSHFSEITALGPSATAALFSLLPQDLPIRHRAAEVLGTIVASLYKKEPDRAKEYCRRFMWQMNEDSGNIGWGIPEAFAETLAASPELANQYANILISYIMDLGHADNYCDHDILRRSCYWAVGRLAQAQPELAEKARPWLIKGLNDDDPICQGMAVWALSQLPANMMDAPFIKKLANSGETEECEFYSGENLEHIKVVTLARMALNHALGLPGKG